MIVLNAIGCRISFLFFRGVGGEEGEGDGGDKLCRLGESELPGAKVMMAQCFSADPGVLSKYNMDAPGPPARSSAGRLFAEGHLGSWRAINNS